MDTDLSDTFFDGSAAFMPMNGQWNTLTYAGGSFDAADGGYDETACRSRRAR